MRQFDVYAPPSGPPVVLIQSDLLDSMPTRVAIPLIDIARSDMTFKALTPVVHLNGIRYLLAPQVVATFTLAELGKKIGTLSDQNDRIIRAIDALLSGI